MASCNWLSSCDHHDVQPDLRAFGTVGQSSYREDSFGDPGGGAGIGSGTPVGTSALAAALSDLVEDMRRLVSDSGVSIRWNGPGCDVSLPDEQATALYRIAQESIANALILVSLHCEAHRLVLTVEDDGTGMPPGKPAEGHYGLAGMQERARMAGGCLQIASAPGEGTTVTLEVNV